MKATSGKPLVGLTPQPHSLQAKKKEEGGYKSPHTTEQCTDCSALIHSVRCQKFSISY
jgi:hypothetical protein